LPKTIWAKVSKKVGFYPLLSAVNLYCYSKLKPFSFIYFLNFCSLLPVSVLGKLSEILQIFLPDFFLIPSFTMSSDGITQKLLFFSV